MISSRRGGSNLLNHVGASGKEMRAHYTCLAYEEKGDASTKRVSPFYLTCTKKIFNIIFST
jgi:hypothetical protein